MEGLAEPVCISTSKTNAQASGGRQEWLEFGPGFQRSLFRTWIHGVVREDDIGGGAVAGTGVQAGLALDRREGWGASRRGGFFSFQWESSWASR